jgi:hypothetical protein
MLYLGGLLLLCLVQGNDSSEDSYDDPFEGMVLRTFHHNCRDDSSVNCTEVHEDGGCDPLGSSQLLNYREICPVTCGYCELPNETKVWIDDSCLEYGEDIETFYTNTNPDPEDFVGIYPSYTNTSDPEEVEGALLWFYTSGSMTETCRTAIGGLNFGDIGPTDHEDWAFFPLAAGNYKAALIQGSTDNTVISVSDTFVAMAKGEKCTVGCKDLVYADSSCYTPEKAMHFTFEICEPSHNDRVAIHSSTVETPDLEKPLLWLGTCGDQLCMDQVETGTLTFGPKDPEESDTTTWPLPPGEYKAFLMRMNEGGEFGKHSTESASFTINLPGETCYQDEEDL